MIHKLRIQRIGDSLGAIFPKEMLERLQLDEGSELVATDTPNGISLTVVDPHFDAAMKAFRRRQERYQNTLRRLAE